MKLQACDAIKLLKGVKRLYISKGTKSQQYDISVEDTNIDEIVALMLGPTGNLRAPTLVCGENVLVGFNADTYSEVLLGAISYKGA